MEQHSALNILLNKKNVSKILFFNSSYKADVSIFQQALIHLGYKQIIKKADGLYGKLTTEAVVEFAAKNKLQTDGKKITPKLAKKILAGIVESISEETTQPLIVEYKNTMFTGKPIKVHNGFTAALNRLNNYAKEADVKLLVIDSLRSPDKVLSGTVVTPSKVSNHFVGHAIDMNILYGVNYKTLCNSKEMAKENLPFPVNKFISLIRADKELRWGGDFKTKDTVHIDDYYNKDMQKWNKLFNEIHNKKK